MSSAYMNRIILRSGAFSRLLRPFPKDSVPAVTAARAAQELIVSPPTERDRVRAALIAAGLSLPAPTAPVAGQLTNEQREELARRTGDGTPLSQIIIEERRGR